MRTPRAPFRRLAALAAAVLAAGTISLATSSPPASAATTFTSTVVNQASGDCADDPNSSTTAGTQLIQYSCNTGTNQNWTFAPVSGTTATYTITNG
ncbi:MAG: RICIN domain-containing protein, partial [Catenulispora sp.]|nr:RICIN domain-containing protein [Catenulispora sp.]